MFREQHPSAWFNMCKYEILNWPQGVDKRKSKMDQNEIELIKKEMEYL